MSVRRIEVVEISCPLCGASKKNELCTITDATYGIEGTYQVVRCVSCQHMYLNPRPADTSLIDIYPAEYAPHSESQSAETDRDETDRDETAAANQANQHALMSGLPPVGFVRRIFRLIPGLRPFLNWLGQENATYLPPPEKDQQSRLLEVGCAHGSFMARGSDAGWIVDGVEPSAMAAEAARKRGFGVFCGLLADAGVASSSREMVAMWMVLEHVPDPVDVVEQVFRILTPGGTFACSVPNASTWERWMFGRYWLGYDAPRHLQVFTAKRLKRLLSDRGFTDIRIIYQANTRYWWGSTAAWGLSKFPNQSWPGRWMEYFKTEPPAVWKWLLLLPGKLVSVTRCSGRITVVAQKPR